MRLKSNIKRRSEVELELTQVSTLLKYVWGGGTAILCKPGELGYSKDLFLITTQPHIESDIEHE